MNPHDDAGIAPFNRREAIRRAAILLGAALSPSLLRGAIAAGSDPKVGDKKRSYLSGDQAAAISAIAERILPSTDTPGARDVGVPAFIDLMFGEFMTDEERNTLILGLSEIDKASRDSKGFAFAQLDQASQDEILVATAVRSQGREGTFFHLMRETTLLGYFTSEKVGRTVLHYDPIPGRYNACVPIAEVGNISWTT
jgi:gluconate 2-dehydrogenase gamma chain